jgi:hypothetical protein
MRHDARTVVRRTAGRVLATTVLIGAVAACGGGDTASRTLQPLPAEWSASGQRTVERVAREIRAGDAEVCRPVSFLNPASLGPARERYGWLIAPEALANCNFEPGEDSEVLEIGAFRTAADRDAFVDERTRGICRRAAAVAAEVPPFAWVTGDAWSVQADSRASARRIARATGGEADVRTCDLDDTLGWTREGVRTVRAIVSRASGAVPCSGFGLADRETVVDGTEGLATPAALGTCAISVSSGASGATGAVPDAVVLVAAFDGESQSRAEFLEDALTGASVCARPASAVVGTLEGGLDWAMVVPTEYAEATAAAALGTVGRSCG